jgi:hypothetical protein
MILLTGHLKNKQLSKLKLPVKNKQTKKSDNPVTSCPKVKSIQVKEVENVFKQTTQSTVIELKFDSTVIYMGIAEAYKLEKELKSTLGLV